MSVAPPKFKLGQKVSLKAPRRVRKHCIHCTDGKITSPVDPTQKGTCPWCRGYQHFEDVPELAIGTVESRTYQDIVDPRSLLEQSPGWSYEVAYSFVRNNRHGGCRTFSEDLLHPAPPEQP